MFRNIFLFFLFALPAVCLSQEILPVSEKNLDSIINSKRDKVLLVNLWATWCAPCREEFPDLIKLYNDYKEKGFEMVFISLDVKGDIENKTIPFLKKNNVNFVTYYNDFSNNEQLLSSFEKKWSGAIPTTFIYDSSGNLTTTFIGNRNYKTFESEIVKLLYQN